MFRIAPCENGIPKLDGPLACLMPSSAIECANSTVRENFNDGTIDEDSHSISR